MRKRMLVLLTCIALIAPSPSPSPSADPQVAALVRKLFEQSQAGKIDPALLAPSARAALTPSLQKEAGKDLSRLGAPTAMAFVASQPLMSTSGTGYEFRFSFAKAPPLNFYVATDPAGEVLGMIYFPVRALAHLGQAQLIGALRARLQHAAKNGGFSGTVLLAKNGAPVFEQAYGMANRAGRIPNTLDTKFRIGSMNKMFTAVAILQLVQAGRMVLSDPIGKYIPDYPNHDVATKVTIEELLTHTGGTGDFFGPQFDAHRLQLRTLDDYVRLFGSRAPAFTPGSKFEYSNYGFILLGVAIERVSGESYYDYVRTHVYEPARMTSTGSDPEDVPVANRSVGYTTDKGKTVANTDTLPYRGTSAGGGYSTVGDLLGFANALQAHVLLNPEYTAMLTTGRVRMPAMPDENRKYAFGFGDQLQNGIRCFGHDGGAPGMNGALDICPVPGYTFVALANVDPPAADDLADFAVDNMPL